MRPTSAIVAGTALIVVAAGLARQPPADAKLDVQLRPRAIVVPRQEPDVTLHLRAGTRTRVSPYLLSAGGQVLARGRAVRLQPGRSRLRSLRPTELGRRLLGRCDTRRVAFVARAGSRRSAQVVATPSADPLRCGPLRWAPPPLEAPQTVALGAGYTKLRLEPGRDYVLRLPGEVKVGGAFIEGGRNVVVIGGHISLPAGTTTDDERRALYFKGQTGTVHVEGVLIDGSQGGEGDAVAINAPQAIVQVQNTRVWGLRGSQAGTHGDIVQPWGGVRELRIDRLTGSSRFQGLQLPQAQGPVGPILIRYANLRALSPFTRDARIPGRGSGGHMLWLTPPGTCTTAPVALEQVYVRPRADRSLRTTVWPGVGDGAGCAAVARGHDIAWPGLPVRGTVTAGAPSGGDFVPQANVGLRYRTPGYVVAG